MLDLDVLRALRVVPAADAARRHQVDAELVVHRRDHLVQPVALHVVEAHEERIGAGNAQELAGLSHAARGGALGLAEHVVRAGLLDRGHLRDRRDDGLVAVEDQQEVGLAELARVVVLDRRQREGAAPVGRVGVVVVVDLAVVVDRDVLQPAAGLGERAVDGGLVARVKAVGLGEAAVLGGEDLAALDQRHDVVLHRQRVVLPRERRGGLAGARQADDQRDLVTLGRRDQLGPGVHRQRALLVAPLHPHAQAAHLRLAEVVDVEHARDPVLQVDGDEPVVGVALRRAVRRVDDGERVLLAPVRVLGVVQLLLHRRDVGVRGLR